MLNIIVNNELFIHMPFGKGSNNPFEAGIF